MTSSVDNPTDKKRLLIVDDDIDVSNMLRAFFEVQGYEVSFARRGEDAILMVREKHPHIILLDIVLPGIDGYEVCREIRQKTETSHIPIIFLTIKDERSDKVAGLELGADDYITKPFEIDELKLRVKNAIERADWEANHDTREITFPIPSLRLIEDQLRELQNSSRAWTHIDLKIRNFDGFKESYGNLASLEVRKLLHHTIMEILDELGTQDDFLGQLSLNNFIVTTYSDKPDHLIETLVKRFNADVLLHYSDKDRQQQYIVLLSGEKCPLMTLRAKSTHQFPIEAFDLT